MWLGGPSVEKVRPEESIECLWSRLSRPQDTADGGTPVCSPRNGAAEERLPCGKTVAEPGAARGSGALGPSVEDPPVASLVSVMMRVEVLGFWQGPDSPPCNRLFLVLDAPGLGPILFCSSMFRSWAGYPGILCVNGSWVICYLA